MMQHSIGTGKGILRATVTALALVCGAFAPVEPAPKEGPRERLGRKSLDQSVSEAQVIFVGTAMDAAPAPPKVKGDAPEHLIRYRVVRVLKGELTDKFVFTRTPTDPAEFIGRDWVVMLSPEFVAGKHNFAGTYTIKLEPDIKAAVAKQKGQK
jgi:hypothetical protein